LTFIANSDKMYIAGSDIKNQNNNPYQLRSLTIK